MRSWALERGEGEAMGSFGSQKTLSQQIAAASKLAPSMQIRGARWRDRIATVVRIALGLALGLCIWQIMAIIMNSNGSSLGFPYPLQTFERLGEYFFEGRALYGHSIFEHLLASIRRLLIAFGLASVVGITLGSLLGYFGRIYQIGMVPVAVYQMIPGLAWLPIAILLFGLGYGAYYATADMPIPMVADCSDYETYRSGKYIPGIMGTLFSLVDKLVSSLAQTLVAFIFLALAGLPELPTDATPYSAGVKLAVIVMFCLIPMLAWAATLWAMKGYSLTGAKMKEIQAVNSARKQAIARGMTLEEAMERYKGD